MNYHSLAVLGFPIYSLHRYSMGIIPTRKNLELCDKVNASAFCRYVRKHVPFLWECAYVSTELHVA